MSETLTEKLESEFGTDVAHQVPGMDKSAGALVSSIDAFDIFFSY